jgi:hypothetical protein
MLDVRVRGGAWGMHEERMLATQREAGVAAPTGAAAQSSPRRRAMGRRARRRRRRRLMARQCGHWHPPLQARRSRRLRCRADWHCAACDAATAPTSQELSMCRRGVRRAAAPTLTPRHPVADASAAAAPASRDGGLRLVRRCAFHPSPPPLLLPRRGTSPHHHTRTTQRPQSTALRCDRRGAHQVSNGITLTGKRLRHGETDVQMSTNAQNHKITLLARNCQGLSLHV